MPPIPPRSSPSRVALSFAVSLLVCLAVCALVLWIGGRVVFILAISSSWLMRSLGRDDNGGGNNCIHTKHWHSCPGIIVSPLALCLGLLWHCVALCVVVGLFIMRVHLWCGHLACNIVALPAVPSSGPWCFFLDCCVILGPFVFSFGLTCGHWVHHHCIVVGIGFRAHQGGLGCECHGQW